PPGNNVRWDVVKVVVLNRRVLEIEKIDVGVVAGEGGILDDDVIDRARGARAMKFDTPVDEGQAIDGDVVRVIWVHREDRSATDLVEDGAACALQSNARMQSERGYIVGAARQKDRITGVGGIDGGLNRRRIIRP